MPSRNVIFSRTWEIYFMLGRVPAHECAKRLADEPQRDHGGSSYQHGRHVQVNGFVIHRSVELADGQHNLRSGVF